MPATTETIDDLTLESTPLGTHTVEIDTGSASRKSTLQSVVNLVLSDKYLRLTGGQLTGQMLVTHGAANVIGLRNAADDTTEAVLGGNAGSYFFTWFDATLGMVLVDATTLTFGAVKDNGHVTVQAVGTGAQVDLASTLPVRVVNGNTYADDPGIELVDDGTATPVRRAYFWHDSSENETIVEATTGDLVIQAPSGKVTLKNKKIEDVLDPTADQDAATKKYVDDNAGSGSGDALTETFTAGEAIAVDEVVYVGNDSKVYLASNAAVGTASGPLYIATEAIVLDATGSFTKMGAHATTGRTAGDDYWLGTGGALTTTKPGGSAQIRYLGRAISATQIDWFGYSAWITSGAAAGGLSHSAETITTGNLTGVIGTLHDCTIAGMTAERNAILPAPTAIGQRIRIRVDDGDDEHELVIKGDTGVTINGGTAATEDTRIFIAKEFMDYYSTSLTNWETYIDGRIPCYFIGTDATGQTHNVTTTQVFDVAVDTPERDVGDLHDAANDRPVVRRAGDYKITLGMFFTALGTNISYSINIGKNGGGVTASGRHRSTQSSVYTYECGGVATAYDDASAGDYYQARVYNNDPTDRTIITLPFIVEEILP